MISHHIPSGFHGATRPRGSPRYKPGVEYEPISDQRLTAESHTATQEAEEERKTWGRSWEDHGPPVDSNQLW